MLTVVWDVDDVLNDLMYQWFTYGWLSEYPDCQLSYSELSANPPYKVLGVSREEYLASMDTFRETKGAIDMQPNLVILTWFREQGDRFRHIALTARPLETAPDVAYWVMRYFGSWIRCFGVVPTRTGRDVPVYHRNKGEYLQWLGKADILVDDSTDNICQAESLGLRTLLYPQPWNNSVLTTAALLQRLSEMAG